MPDFNTRISHAYYRGTRDDLQKLQIEILNERQKIGEFIDRFLEEYDTEMSTAHPSDPKWKLFRDKHREYGDMEQYLRNINYFLNK